MESKSTPEKRCQGHLGPLTRDWGAWNTVSLYLDRCQVDTPDNLVAATWAHVNELRARVGKVVDFGAGDGRFATHGVYSHYAGYEIDPERCKNATLPANARLFNRCAFSDKINDADLCIGNPPFVRNQDLPEGWRLKASEMLRQRTGLTISGLANAWQYFFLLALASLKPDGLCALIIPYEWVSRPSAKALRTYITENNWNVSVYRLIDTTFNSVLTTASITIVDKAAKEGIWRYHEETASRQYTTLPSPCKSDHGVIRYVRRSQIDKNAPYAMRGLSPGTQKILTLTEGERVRNGLDIEHDVVPCVTTLRHIPIDVKTLDSEVHNKYYKTPGNKCWLIRTDITPSKQLQAYLDSIPEQDYQTSTCKKRGVWWKFSMPPIPDILISTGFKGKFPKYLRNNIGARAVGGVCGAYNISKDKLASITDMLDSIDIRERVVEHAKGLKKIEINQMNAILNDALTTYQANTT